MAILCQCSARDLIILATMMNSIHPQTGFIQCLETLRLPAISKGLSLSHVKKCKHE